MKTPVVFACFGAAFVGPVADAAAKWWDPFCKDKHEIPASVAVATSGTSLSATDAYHSITGEERSGRLEQKK